MGLESGTYISDLNEAWPPGASDPVSQGDDHIRLIKSTLKNTFPNITGAVTATQDLLNGVIKHNRAASASPTVNDDSSQGYSAGSFWLDTTNDEVWVCVDPSTGAAKWVRLGGQLIARTIFSTPGVTSHTWNTSTRYTIAEVWGGGGAGGGAPAASAGESEGGGGGGGEYSVKLILYSDLSAGERPGGSPGSVSVTVGGGGSGGTGNGAAGATSSYGAHCTAVGGEGGVQGTDSSSSVRSAGGAGGSGGTGDLTLAGSYGGTGRIISGKRGFHAYGGSSPRGGSSVGENSNSAGLAGLAPGGGGSGANDGTGTTRNGGDGADGMVITWEYS